MQIPRRTKPPNETECNKWWLISNNKDVGISFIHIYGQRARSFNFILDMNYGSTGRNMTSFEQVSGADLVLFFFIQFVFHTRPHLSQCYAGAILSTVSLFHFVFMTDNDRLWIRINSF